MSERPPLAVLLRSGGHDAAHYALVLATTAAALGRPALVFCTNAGCALLRRDAPLQADPREARLRERGVATLETLLDAAGELGVRLIACEAGLRVEAIEASALREDAEVAGAATLLGAAAGGQIVAL